jgi:hypothetical protein
VLTSPADLATFTGHFRIPLSVSGHATGSVTSGHGDVSTAFQTDTSATITIIYHYILNLPGPFRRAGRTRYRLLGRTQAASMSGPPDRTRHRAAPMGAAHGGSAYPPPPIPSAASPPDSPARRAAGGWTREARHDT